MVTYQCDDGFEPTEGMVTVCSAMGHWVPDTATFMCTTLGVHVCVHVYYIRCACVCACVLNQVRCVYMCMQMDY